MSEVSIVRGRGELYFGDSRRVIDLGETTRVNAASRCLVRGVSLIGVSLGKYLETPEVFILCV